MQDILRRSLESIAGLLGPADDAAPSEAADPTAPPSPDLSPSRTSLAARMPGALVPPRSLAAQQSSGQGSSCPRQYAVYRRPEISDDELRLCPNYEYEFAPACARLASPPAHNHSRPADAVPLPPPSAFLDNQSPVMKPTKPGAGKSFRPTDTLSSPASRSHGHPRTTYTASSKPPHDFRTYFQGSPRGRALGDEHAHPSKRRKLDEEPSLPQEVIDIDADDDDDDDEVMEVTSPTIVKAAHSPHSSRPVSSRSHLSGGNGSRRGSVSAFQQVQQVADPHRKKPRKQLFTPYSVNSFSPQAVPTKTRDVYDSLDDDELYAEPEVVTSRHFASVRPNDPYATQHRTAPAVNGGHGHASYFPHSDNYRGQFKQISQADAIVDDQADELAGPLGFLERGSHKRSPTKQQTPSKARHQKVTSKKQPQPAMRLSYYSTYDMNFDFDDVLLQQRVGEDRKFDIRHVRKLGEEVVLCTIDLDKVNRAETDEISAIRLLGGTSGKQGRYWFDLRFEDPRQFRFFAEHVLASTINTFQFTSTEMQVKFRNPPVRKAKENPSRAVPSPIARLPQSHPTVVENPKQRPQAGALIGRLNPQAKVTLKANPQPAPEGPRKPRGGSPEHISEARPVRSTRSNRSFAEKEPPAPEPEPEPAPMKYSVEHGLGPPWKGPVQYGKGKLRTTVFFEDLLKLDEGEYLSDSLIMFYMAYLFDQARVPPNKVYMFNTFFHSSLTDTGRNYKAIINYDKVKGWTRDVDIFSYDYILVPVHESQHWFLAIICNVGNIPRDLAIKHIDTSPPPVPSSGSPNGALMHPTETRSIGPSPSTKAADEVGSGDDPNLFEEEQCRLAEPDAKNTVFEADYAGQITRKASPAATEAAHMERLTIDDMSIPKGIIGDTPSSPASQKKGKRRNGMKVFDPNEPIIIILDSLGGSHPKTSKALKTYIQDEGRSRRAMDAIISQNVFYPKDAHIPMQPNYTDCGVYVLGYVEKFLANPTEFVTKLLRREMDRETDWPDMKAPAIRAKMREILQAMAAHQHKVAKEAHKQKKLAAQKPQQSSPAKPASQAVPATAQPALTGTNSSPLKPKNTTQVQPLSASQPTKTEQMRSTPVRKINPLVVVQSPSRRQLERLDQETMAHKEHKRRVKQSEPEPPASPTKRRKPRESAAPICAHSSPKTARDPPRAKAESLPSPHRATQPPAKPAPTPNRNREFLRGSSLDPISIDDSQDSITLISPPKPKKSPPKLKYTPIQPPQLNQYPKKVHIHGSTPERQTAPVLPVQPMSAEHRRTRSTVIPETQELDSAIDDSFVGIDDRPSTSDGVVRVPLVSQLIELDADEEGGEGDWTIPESPGALDEVL